MKTFLEGWKWVVGGIGFVMSFIFYGLLQREEEKNIDAKMDNAEKEAELKAKEKHDKVKDNPVAAAVDIADILDKG